MAKFLPFVVEKSTPLHIYQTLITRSKGINNVLIASIFYLVISKGISSIRSSIEDLPEMPTSSLYETLIDMYPDFRISNEIYSILQSIKPLVSEFAFDSFHDDLKEYEITDILNFILVMYMIKGEVTNYTSLPFEKMFTEDLDAHEKDLTNKQLFSSSAELSRVFFSKDELKAYVHFFSVIKDSGQMDPVRAVLSIPPVIMGVDPAATSPEERS